MSDKTFDDMHEAHPGAILSLTEERPDGGRILRSWPVCMCMIDQVRAQLGEPVHETYSNAEQVGRMVQVARENGVHRFGSEGR